MEDRILNRTSGGTIGEEFILIRQLIDKSCTHKLKRVWIQTKTVRKIIYINALKYCSVNYTVTLRNAFHYIMVMKSVLFQFIYLYLFGTGLVQSQGHRFNIKRTMPMLMRYITPSWLIYMQRILKAVKMIIFR